MHRRSSVRCRSTGAPTIPTSQSVSTGAGASRSSSWTVRRTPPAHIHLGTAWNKILKDSILRYYRMCGRHVIDRAGYDMHGLPIEVKVEQALGFVSKKDIETFGIQPFIEKCREFAIENKVLMDDQFAALGVWMDFPGAYQTVKPEYIEAAWWTLATGRGPRDARARPPGRELVPPVRDGDRGRRSGVLGRERPLGFRQVPPHRKARRIPPHLDNNPLDPAGERGRRGLQRVRVRKGTCEEGRERGIPLDRGAPRQGGAEEGPVQGLCHHRDEERYGTRRVDLRVAPQRDRAAPAGDRAQGRDRGLRGP